jgi:hypothetical protein
VSEIAWAAGLFEGEGCIEMWQRKHSAVPIPRISVKMTDRDVVERFTAAVGVGKVYGPYQPKRVNVKGEPVKPIYVWQIVRITDIQRILGDFWPYLGQRRKAKSAETIARYYESPRRALKLQEVM